MLKAQDIPNLLTGARIVFAVAVFLGLAAAAGSLPGQSSPPGAAAQKAVCFWSLGAFILAAVTDFFDGWLARKLNAQSAWGAMLDPIADKIAVLGAVVGLVAIEPRPAVAVAGTLILVRELFVSGLREMGGQRGLKFPVTRLAKWKTTLQLVALSLEILTTALVDRGALQLVADLLLWLAAAVTVWTGLEYAAAARKGLKGGSPGQA